MTKLHVFNLVNLKYDKFSSVIISSANNLVNKSSTIALKAEKYNSFISRNFWQKFINQYWQETIFISTSSTLSENYINKLKSSGLSVYKGNDYKNFLLKFSRDLLNGKIAVSTSSKYNSKFSSNVSKDNTYIKYRWSKFLYFNTISLNVSQKVFQDKISVNNKIIKYKTLPLFVLVNNNCQIVMSESSDKLLRGQSFFISLSKLLGNFLVNRTSDQKLYTGLLFINPEDALEYKKYIHYNYDKSTRINSVQSAISNMSLYYELLNSSARNTDFRLIPDLKEMSDLIYKYQKYRNLSFDFHQKYGSNYFQGQPIYLIKSIYVKNKNTNQKEMLNYSYVLSKNNAQIKYQVVFLNYQTAVAAWNNFRQEYSYYQLPMRPELYVSNLESFIKTSYYKKTYNQIIFIPSLQTYKFVKKSIQLGTKSNNFVKQAIWNKSLFLKTLISRIIWSLTSRQPVNW